jgi:hypothetical protein
MGINEFMRLDFGAAKSAYNCGEIEFKLVGGGSASNNMGFGLNGFGDRMRVHSIGVDITPTTASTSTNSGALVVVGGVAIGGTTDATNATNGGALTCAGGAGINGKLYVGSTTDASTTSTGALVVNGGVGIMTTTEATSATNGGALTVAGGCGFNKNVYVGGGVYLPTSGGTASPLNYYEETTHVTKWRKGYDGTLTADKTLKLTRIGNIVFCNIPVIVPVANDATTAKELVMIETAVPARFRPSATTKSQFIQIYDATANTMGVPEITDAGVIRVFRYDGLIYGTTEINIVASCFSWNIT